MGDFSTPISELRDIHPVERKFDPPQEGSMKQSAERLNEQLSEVYQNEIAKLQNLLQSKEKQIDHLVAAPVEVASSYVSTFTDILTKKEYLLIIAAVILLFSSQTSGIIARWTPKDSFLSLIVKALLVVLIYHFGSPLLTKLVT